MIATRDIATNEDLLYDYGVRSKKWMKKRGQGKRESSGDGGEVVSAGEGRGDAHQEIQRTKKSRGQEMKETGGASGCADGSHDWEDQVETDGGQGSSKRYKHNYFWCPEMVQKVTQHL